MIEIIKREYAHFSRVEKLFILFAMVCGFLISTEYAIIRPVSNSLLITYFGASFLPYVWLAAVPLSFLIVSCYNKYLPHFGPYRMLKGIAIMIIATNVSAAFLLPVFPSLTFLFFIWKEIYVMLMFQQLWSVIHSVISVERAKYLFGLIFAIGGLGAAFGSLMTSLLAVKVGSENLLLSTAPLYLLLIGFFRFALKNTTQGIDFKVPPPANQAEKLSLFSGFSLIVTSRYLTFILAIVVLMQLSSSLIEFQFNTFLEKAVLQKDLRTEYVGKLFAIVQCLTITLQMIGTFFLVRLIGVKGSHFLVPFLLCCSSIAFLFFPLLGVISLSFVAVKAFDFSLFGVTKEMLFTPLKPQEKFQAKAFIDVFAHRSSKALASLLILSLQFFHLSPMVSWVTVGFFFVWLLLVGIFLKPKEERVID